MQCFRGILTYSLMAVTAIMIQVGCSSKDDGYSEPAPNSDPIEEVHGAHKPGPHGGQLLDLGDHEYMAEVVFHEDDPKSITIYLIDHDDNSKAILTKDETLTIDGLNVDGKETSLTLVSKPLDGEADGDTSRFEVIGDGIPEGIEDMHELGDGSFSVMIGEKSYNGTIEHLHEDGDEHEAHGDEGKHHDEDGDEGKHHDKDDDDNKHHDGDKDDDGDHKSDKK